MSESDSQRIMREVGMDDTHPWLGGCGCWTCTSDRVTRSAFPWSMPMCVCVDCGNKRCPRATHHLSPCTGSNEPGQEGSMYAHAPSTAPLTPSQPSADHGDGSGAGGGAEGEGGK